MKPLVLALIGSVACAGAAFAQSSETCAVAEHLVVAEAGLPHAAAAVENHRLPIIVIGTASSVLPGRGGERSAYPARLEAALSKRLPGVSVKVTNDSQTGLTAADMVEQFSRLLDGEKPALVVWQSGTVDAMRGVDLDDFRTTLEDGVDKLQARGADVILMNMQFSPRTESMIAVEGYAEVLRGVALHRELPLFDRLAIMKEWSDLGTFDLYSTTKNPELAEHVHECLGELLAGLVVQAIKLSAAELKDSR